MKDLPTSSRASIAPLVIISWVCWGSSALQSLEARCDRVQSARQPLGGRILKCAGIARGGKLRQERGSSLARKSLWIREASGKRDELGVAGEREDLRESRSHSGASALREQPAPAPNPLIYRHSSLAGRSL